MISSLRIVNCVLSKIGSVNKSDRFARLFVVHCKIMSTQRDIEEDLKENPYYLKYASKIQNLQNTSPEEFKARLEDNQLRKTKVDLSRNKTFSPVAEPKLPINEAATYKRRKALNDIMKMELIENLPPADISKLWESYFKDKDGISAAIPTETYKIIEERGKKYPVFIFPLPRGNGYEFFLGQVAGDEVHFTSLINYQAHKENAPEYLTMVHFTELKNKGIVLMHGEYVKDIFNGMEALCLANQFQLYYGQQNEKRLALLERFNCQPSEFKHMDLIAELESLSL